MKLTNQFKGNRVAQKFIPDMRLDPEEEVKAQEGGHHDDVAADAEEVADLVCGQEELVHKPEKKVLEIQLKLE